MYNSEGYWIPDSKDFSLSGMEQMATSNGIFWRARLLHRGRHVGYIEDDGKAIVPRVDFWLDPDMREIWEQWCHDNGDPDWVRTSLDAAGAAALSNLYYFEVERHAS